jgi:hypothetical protein
VGDVAESVGGSDHDVARLLSVWRIQGVAVTTTDASLMPLILQLGRAAAATMDVAAALRGTARTADRW